MKTPHRQSGFTFIELLIVIAFIVIIAAIVSDAVKTKQTRDETRKISAQRWDNIKSEVVNERQRLLVDYIQDKCSNLKSSYDRGGQTYLDNEADCMASEIRTLRVQSYAASSTPEELLAVEALMTRAGNK